MAHRIEVVDDGQPGSPAESWYCTCDEAEGPHVHCPWGGPHVHRVDPETGKALT
jgi:hypothetical protein